MDYQALERAARMGMDSLLYELDSADCELARIVEVASMFDERQANEQLEITIQEYEDLINNMIAPEVCNLARRIMKSKGKPEKVGKAIRKWQDALKSDIENIQNFRPLLRCLENIHE